MAYLIHQLDYMIQKGIDVHCVAVPGGYHEIDTIEDYHLASREWGKGPELDAESVALSALFAA